MTEIVICPLCQREIPKVGLSRHHWIPQRHKGKVWSYLHEVCHRKIHSLFNENELRDYYNTPEHLLESDEMQKFVKWVSKRPIDFNDYNKQHKRLRRG